MVNYWVIELLASYHTPMASFLKPDANLYLVASWNISVYLWPRLLTAWIEFCSRVSKMSLNAPCNSMLNLVSSSLDIKTPASLLWRVLSSRSHLMCCSNCIFSFLRSLIILSSFKFEFSVCYPYPPLAWEEETTPPTADLLALEDEPSEPPLMFELLPFETNSCL